MKVAGVLLIILACLALSAQNWFSMRQANENLSSICHLLELMQGELETRATPLPDLFASIEPFVHAGAGSLVRRIQKSLPSLGNTEFARIWEKSTLEVFPGIDKHLQRELLALGSVLGRYDTTRQCDAIRACRLHFSRDLEKAVQSSPQRTRIMLILPLTAGILMIILLI